jgi:hypothetical protein
MSPESADPERDVPQADTQQRALMSVRAGGHSAPASASPSVPASYAGAKYGGGQEGVLSEPLPTPSVVDRQRTFIPGFTRRGSMPMRSEMESLGKEAGERRGRRRPACATWHSSPSGDTELQVGCEPIGGVLIEDELIAQAMWPRLDLAPRCLAQEVVKPGSGRYLIGWRVDRSRAWLSSAGNLAFERPDRPPAFGRATRQQAPPAVVGFSKKRVAVALRKRARVDQFERFVG